MSMKEWASREVELACKRENPDWDGESFDYGCACYQSALKAFNSLVDDGHSGFSIAMTQQILNRLIDQKPLTPITEADFDGTGFIHDGTTSWQCPRMRSLFKDQAEDGKIAYRDIRRVYCINVNDEHEKFFGYLGNVVDELFPITLPYIPEDKPYKVFIERFLYNEESCNFDHERVLYIITPKGEKIPVTGWCFMEFNGEMQRCDESLYLARHKEVHKG